MRSIAPLSLGLLATQALALPTSNSPPPSIKVPAPHWTNEKLIEARDGNITARNDGGGWIVTAKVGPDSLTLNVDTGSSDL